MMSQIFINYKCDQSLKGAIYSIDVKKKILEGGKMFTHFNERVLEGPK
jgi:hypothetical protein